MRFSASFLGLTGLLACLAAPAWAAAAPVVPESASLPLLMLAATGLLVGRRLSR